MVTSHLNGLKYYFPMIGLQMGDGGEREGGGEFVTSDTSLNYNHPANGL
jgi:hypothetical protein